MKVELSKEANPTAVKQMKPDVIIIASGSETFFPAIPGIDNSMVYDARKVVAGTVKVSDKVVVIGGGEVGMETAQLLAEQGKKVTLIEMLPTVGEQIVRDVYYYINEHLIKHNVEILTNTSVEKITSNGVHVIDKEHKRRSIKADTVVIATGAKPNKKVQDELQGLAGELYLAGDCLVPCNIRLAIHQGSMIGRMLY